MGGSPKIKPSSARGGERKPCGRCGCRCLCSAKCEPTCRGPSASKIKPAHGSGLWWRQLLWLPKQIRWRLRPREDFTPALSAPTFFLQPRPPPPLLAAAMESSTFALVPLFVQLSILQSLVPAAGAAAPVAISALHLCYSALHLCYSHVTPGHPGAGAGQDPAPS